MGQTKGKGGGMTLLAAVAAGVLFLGWQGTDSNLEIDAAYSRDDGASLNVAMGGDGLEGQSAPPSQRPQPLFAQAPSEQQHEAQPAALPFAESYFANCSEARAAGAAPVSAGDPGYAPHLDRDDDGVGCEIH